MKREDGFYWVNLNGTKGDSIPCEYSSHHSLDGGWFIPGYDKLFSEAELDLYSDGKSEIGPHVQHDSEMVKQLDEAVALLEEAKLLINWANPDSLFTQDEKTNAYNKIRIFLDRVKAEKSGVTP